MISAILIIQNYYMHNLSSNAVITQTHSPNNKLALHICNLNYLTSVTRGNSKMINSIVSVFFKETRTELRSLRAAISDGNYPAISSLSHKLKSAFLLMGITVLKPVFEEMEKLGTAASGIERIGQLNHNVNAVFRQAKKEINFYMQPV